MKLSVKGYTFLAFAVLLAAPFASAISEQAGWDSVPAILEQINAPEFPAVDFPVTDYGAEGNGDTDCTKAFAKAVEACSEAGGGRVVVPEGEFLTGPIHLKSNVNLHLEEGAVVSFFTNLDDYPLVFTRYEGVECINFSPLIYAMEQENIAITGAGTLDGNGSNSNWWRWKWTSKSSIDRLYEFAREKAGVPVEERLFGKAYKLRPVMIQPYRCKNILIEGVTIKNSPMWHINPVLCENITVRGVTIVGHGPNNDGCNPESSKNVLIEDCYFDTGDDCIAIKSGRNDDGRRVGVASENIIVRDCTMKDGHGGVVIGSECSGGVRNVFVEDCLMDSPNLERGLRIKTNSVRGGVIENIFMRNVDMPQVREAALRINFHYGEGDDGDFPPVVRNIYMSGVHCGKSKYPWLIEGYENNPVRDVFLTGCTFENTEKEGVSEGIVNFQVLPEKRIEVNFDRLIADTVLSRNADYWSLDFSDDPKWSYTYGLVNEALWRMYEKTGEKKYRDYVQGYYDRLLEPDGTIKTYKLADYNIDMIKPGSALIKLYQATGDKKYLSAIKTLRKQLEGHPRTSDGGFWHKKRYPHQMWLDGLYMGSPFIARFAGAFNEPALYDDAVKQIILMNKHARDPETGLLYHAWDESREQKWADKETGCAPNFWGRAMGWYAMAIVDVLDELPAEHTEREQICRILNDMFTALVKVQDKESGLWYLVLDQAGRDGNYL
ncbi:MAG: glycoside hydrolase family 88 protein, partial [Phycisphaerae bacterium]